MNTYQAIRTTAELLEENPDLYIFIGGSHVPDGDNQSNEPACLLAWIGYYMGESPETHCSDVADKYFPFLAECMGRSSNEAGFYEYLSRNINCPAWWNQIDEITTTLYLFAEKYKEEFPDVD